jgi:hypothetical protein
MLKDDLRDLSQIQKKLDSIWDQKPENMSKLKFYFLHKEELDPLNAELKRLQKNKSGV